MARPQGQPTGSDHGRDLPECRYGREALVVTPSVIGPFGDEAAGMNDTPLLDAAGRLRSPATMPGFHRGRPPRNKGLRYPADPPPVEEVVAVMRVAGEARTDCALER
jgi:hypothetical protein